MIMKTIDNLIFLPPADNLIIFKLFKFQLYNIHFEDLDQPGHPHGLNGLLRPQCFFMRTANTDQTGWMARLIGFVMLQHKCKECFHFFSNKY